MDLIRKEKRDHIIIRLIFLLGPALIGALGVYLLDITNGFEKTETETQFWLLRAILLLGIAVGTFIIMGIIVHSFFIKPANHPEFIIIKHDECEETYFTCHQIKMWGGLLWELKGINQNFYNDFPTEFSTEEQATKFIEDKIKGRDELKMVMDCKKNKTKKIIHTI